MFTLMWLLILKPDTRSYCPLAQCICDVKDIEWEHVNAHAPACLGLSGTERAYSGDMCSALCSVLQAREWTWLIQPSFNENDSCQHSQVDLYVERNIDLSVENIHTLEWLHGDGQTGGKYRTFFDWFISGLNVMKCVCMQILVELYSEHVNCRVGII